MTSLNPKYEDLHTNEIFIFMKSTNSFDVLMLQNHTMFICLLITVKGFLPNNGTKIIVNTKV